ncbi:MAG: ATP-binding protein [Chloroflexota bacterium]
MPFVNRRRELASLERFWSSGRAECIPVVGRRRVGKTYLLESFATGKRCVYYRCQLKSSSEQLPQLGADLARISEDPVLQAEPPRTWPAIFALIERLAERERLLLVIDEVPYWTARDESLPSTLQNWWDARGRTLDLMLVLCGSAVQMMEKLLTGDAPLAGCITGRLVVRPFDFRAASELLRFPDPLDSLTAYGILGGVPLYLTFFQPNRSIHANILEAIASPTARLYVEPQAVFAAHHGSYDAQQALSVLRAIARRQHQWSDIIRETGLSATQLSRVMEPLVGDLGLVERVLPVTEVKPSRTYFTQYHLTDNFFRFWFQFVEPNQGRIEFGDAERVVDDVISRLPEYMGLPFEAMCRDWARAASGARVLPVSASWLGSWWDADNQVDVVGLDEEKHVIITGECKWQNHSFTWDDLQRYLGHVRALGPRVRPDALHLLFAKSGFADNVRQWAIGTRARLLTPGTLLASFDPATDPTILRDDLHP